MKVSVASIFNGHIIQCRQYFVIPSSMSCLALVCLPLICEVLVCLMSEVSSDIYFL